MLEVRKRTHIHIQRVFIYIWEIKFCQTEIKPSYLPHLKKRDIIH